MNSTPNLAGETSHSPTVAASFFPSDAKLGGLIPEGSTLFDLARTKEDFVELLPCFVVREFEHAARQLTTIL